MNRKTFILIPVLFIIAGFCFAQEISDDADSYSPEPSPSVDNQDYPEDDSSFPEPSSIIIADNQDDPDNPEDDSYSPERFIVVNNQDYLESVHLLERAQEAFEEGDYDVSVYYTEQAAEYGLRSDEYVQIRLTDSTFIRAHNRYVWAGSVGAATRYAAAYRTATAAYNEAVAAQKAEDWDKVFDASCRVLAALANVRGRNGEIGPPAELPPSRPRHIILPAQYTVRQWSNSGDCFSAIAGRSWVYGDASQWRKLYDANKDKLPNPDNPHLILPGMILDIPSLHGEVRSGMWDPQAKY